MSQVINTNIASLNAQRNLNESQGGLQTSLERLSSGLRINSAGDDAAGLAIAERFSAQISGLEQAQRNSNDGISFAQTAEGGLDEIGNLLQRVRELSVQAANDTNSNSDRAALNEEVQQAVAEVNRIAASTQFNDQNVLDGALEDLIFQVGANAGQTIGVDGVDARGSQLGAVIQETTGITEEVVAADVDADGSAAFDFSGVQLSQLNEAAGNFSLDLDDGTNTASIDGDALSDNLQDGNFEQLAGELTELAQAEGLEVEFRGNSSTGEITLVNTGSEPVSAELAATDATGDTGEAVAAGTLDDSGGTLTFDGLSDGNEDVSGTITVNGQDITIDATDLDEAGDLSAAINQAFEDNGFDDLEVEAGEATQDLNETFTITNSGDDAVDVTVNLNQGEASGTVVAVDEVEATADRTLGEVFAAGDSVDFTAEVNGTSIGIQGASNLDDVVSAINAQSQETGVSANLNATNDDIVFSSAAGEDFDVELTVTGQDGRDDVTQDVNATAANDSVFVNDFDVTTRDNATETLTAVDFAIDQVNSLRGDLGATQNRFESTIANLSIGSENLQAARSRIVDADFASETADLTRSQILQQAGTSVLAQANQIPQNVVSLLQ